MAEIKAKAIKNFFSEPASGASIERSLRRTLVRLAWLFGRQEPQRHKATKTHKVFAALCVFVSLWFNSVHAQQSVRTDISLNDHWYTRATDTVEQGMDAFEQNRFEAKDRWKKVDVPHNWDGYEGYRRKLHGNRHGYAYYSKTFKLKPQPKDKRIFLFFEGVGSYATVWLNDKQVGYHAGGRTTFTLDVTEHVRFGNTNLLSVRADHPAGIKDLPWVCGGCSDERGFSEGSQPMGIFRPVHLIITSNVRVQPFGVHVWNDSTASDKGATLYAETSLKNYSPVAKKIAILTRLVDARGRIVSESFSSQALASGEEKTVRQQPFTLKTPTLWSIENPYRYILITELREGKKLLDRLATPYGIRTICWPVGKAPSSNQFLLNGKPVFINGIAEYEHLLGGSHAFSPQQIRARVKQVKAAGFNFFRDAHHPHNLQYGQSWDSLGILSWTQMGAHVWYDSPAFRQNFKTLLTEWVKERRNSASVVLWGLQNESKLPEDFARECTKLIRQLDPTASSQRLVTTCNGGSGTDWDVPQNWTGTYGGNPATYGQDLKRQILVGEYGAWRTLDSHTEGEFAQSGPYSEDRMTKLMETKVLLAEGVKDSTAGHIMWLLTSHDNPGRVQGGEGLRELDRIGPVNYKGLMTPWEEPLDVFYMFRANYAPKNTEPMVYIVSHTWPDRWITAGKKSGLVVYSNCDEVELFNDVRAVSLGRRRRSGAGTHFQWDDASIQYNVLYAVGYVGGKEVATDCILLHHMPQAPSFNKLYAGARNMTAPQAGYNYLYRVHCGGADYTDREGRLWMADRQRKVASTWGSSSWTKDFPGMPPYFASQRLTADPIRGTTDWKLFQHFRFGREKLHYDFPVQDGEYLVELYFTEPWWGTGGGFNATGLRLFDVAINGQVVLKNLDVWKEAGHNGALKKIVKATVRGGLLTVSFPRVAVGQAIICAIAIASQDHSVKPAAAPDPLITIRFPNPLNAPVMVGDWLNTGDVLYQRSEAMVVSLPPEVYGAQWLKVTPGFWQEGGVKTVVLNDSADLFIGGDSGRTNYPDIGRGFDPVTTRMVLSNGKTFSLFKKRLAKGEVVNLPAGEDWIVCAQPASTMEPAYDLKPVTSYKAVAATLNGAGLKRGLVDGKERVIFETGSAENVIEWTFTVGVADSYSLTISYNNPQPKRLVGRLQLLSADNTLMKEEAVELTPTRAGKSNYIATTSGSMINAGRYKLRLTAPDSAGLSINALDVQ